MRLNAMLVSQGYSLEETCATDKKCRAADPTTASEATVVQISTTGPWGLEYVNPKDDPRQRSQ